MQGLKRGYTDPRWATARQIKEMQGHIRKDEHGTGILYYGQRLVIDDDGTEKMRGVVRHYYVFNIEQTNLPVLQREALREVTPDLPAFAELLAIHNPRMAPGEPMYDPNTDTIHMLDKGAFTNDGEYYSAFFHEMGHWTGHESRLNRDLTHPFGTPGYAREELVAELSSFMLSLEHGLPFSPKQSHAYLQGWAERTGQELEEALRQGFKDATAAKNFIDAPLRERQQEREQQVVPATPLTSRDEAEIAPEKDRAVQTKTAQEYQPKDGDVVRTYYTRTGKIGAEVKISISRHETRPISYHYIGKWGAASGVTPEELSKEDAKWRTTRRGITVVDGPAAAIAFGNASLTVTTKEKSTEQKDSAEQAAPAAAQPVETAEPETGQATPAAAQSVEAAGPETEQAAPAAEQSAEPAAPETEQVAPAAEQSAEPTAPEVEQAAPAAHKHDVRETSATTMTSKTSKSADDAVVQAYVAERFDKLFRRAYDEQAMVAEAMTTRRVYLAVSWDERHEAKALGAK
ncbi:zincin-like metallopeptidase domain-containing protein [uncultured Cardiobacterium sp.]|uniref:zincin-like metallopeptidase domain-containing protein n=1 Tax=uncultured Cardiobacterium sp. TaxID=417619 RepID=UPI00262417D8|nr:zincin-like metallopeptidase domain-containing protein [uncultured Cardiobacterium sp.]